MVYKIQPINKQEAKEIRKKCPYVPIYRTQQGKSNRGRYYIPETVIFANDIHFDIKNLKDLISAYDCIKGNPETRIIKGRLKGALKYKSGLLK